VTKQSWRALVVLASVALAGALVSPANSTVGVFLTPLIKEFGWSHAQASRIATVLLLSYGVSGPALGWLLDRVAAQWVMATGVMAVALAFLAASRVHSLGMLVALYAVIGIGVQAAYHIPGYVVTVNWFRRRRGAAMGFFLGVSTAGLALAPTPVTRLVLTRGWRFAMVCMAVPMLVVALPLVLGFARTRPSGEAAASDEQELLAGVPGLEVGPALRSISFWMLSALQVAYFIAFNAVFYHLVPYLISVGYTPPAAAHIFGLQALGAVIGFFINGALTDRYGPRKIIMVGLIMDGCALIELLGAGTSRMGPLPIVAFVMTWGTFASGITGMIPVLLAESLGLRRFGTLLGVLHFVGAVGAAISPVLVGWLVDVTGSYRIVWQLLAVLVFGCLILLGLVRPARGHDAIAEPIAATRAG
jgi:MFS family permease